MPFSSLDIDALEELDTLDDVDGVEEDIEDELTVLNDPDELELLLDVVMPAATAACAVAETADETGAVQTDLCVGQ